MNGSTSHQLPTAVGVLIAVVAITFWVVMVVAMWKVFTKAGKPGWWAIIPLVNTWVLFKIGGKPGWWLFLMWIPIVNIVLSIFALNGVSRNFGKSEGFTVGLFFLPFIFFPILGFGSARHNGVYGENSAPGYGQGYGQPGQYGQPGPYGP